MIYSNVGTISSFFLSKASMSNKKLQKLLYYAYSWTLARLNECEVGIENFLFEEKFEAWVHGPVCPPAYHMFKEHGWRDIPMAQAPTDIAQDVLDILEQVWGVYGGYTADELEDISHLERPWIAARAGLSPFDPCNIRIDDKLIYEYFVSAGSHAS